MSVLVEQKPLAKALAAFKGVVSHRHIPILDCVKLSASAGLLTIEGTDMDMRLRLTLPAEGVMPDVAVPHMRLERFVSQLPGADVTLSPSAGAVNVRAAKSRSSIPALDAEAWPALTEHDGQNAFILSHAELRNIAAFCADPVDENEARQQLRGICIDGPNKAAVGTDGVSFAMWPTPSLDSDLRPIIPSSAIEKYCAVSDGNNAEVTVTDRTVRFRSDGVDLLSKLVEGEFPQWPRLIGKFSTGTHRLVVDRSSLDSALARVIAGSGSHIIGFAIADGALHMRASDTLATSADCSDEISCEISGPDATFGMNGQFLRDALAAFAATDKSARDVEIWISPADRLPATIKIPGADPIRVVCPLTPRILPEIAMGKAA